MHNEKTDLSILIPLYNEKENLAPLSERLKKVLEESGRSWEIVFVDDGSDDGSFEALKTLAAADRRIRVIQFRRNFGKSAAMSAGFAIVQGAMVVTMDADLQDDPREIPAMLKLLDDGYDLVSGWRFQRQDRFIKKYTSRIYNRTTATLSGLPLHDFNCGLKAFRREVIEDVPLYGELHRYIPVLAHWKGYKVGELQVEHHARAFGRSKFGAYRFFAGFMDLFTVMFLAKYSKKPLHLFGGAGLLLFSLGLLINAYLAILKLMGLGIGGRPLLILGLLLMLIGFQFISTGLLGEMLAISLHREREEYTIKTTL
ncbi:MAG: glycosyltransferase family 2 protein [Candidatus Aureabacteria bacterium]|nr:glycosyltransferase family 2 protein [Candidatus Auribacterota bacterium]